MTPSEIRQQLVTAKDELRRIKAALDFPGQPEPRKRHLRAEGARWAARKAALEAELGRST